MHFPHLFQLKHFLILFFPLLLTQVAQIGTSVFSSIFSGQAGTVDLAGVAVAVNMSLPAFPGFSVADPRVFHSFAAPTKPAAFPSISCRASISPYFLRC